MTDKVNQWVYVYDKEKDIKYKVRFKSLIKMINETLENHDQPRRYFVLDDHRAEYIARYKWATLIGAMDQSAMKNIQLTECEVLKVQRF